MADSRKLSWQVKLGASLVLASALLYTIHFFLFHDFHHIVIYLVGDIAFVPIEVLLVTLILHRLLESHEKKAMLSKMNMVIGVFFSEIGSELLSICTSFDTGLPRLKKSMQILPGWKEKNFSASEKELAGYDPDLDPDEEQMCSLLEFLRPRHTFLLTLLENPNLLEHESFTDLLWAIFHLMEELEKRKAIASSNKHDFSHLVNDAKRCYKLLLREWLSYMKHLNRDYPYLYSLAVRTNPFNPEAVVEIKS